MHSIRSRLAFLLVVSVVGVVIGSAIVSWWILEQPDRRSFANSFAEEVRIVASVLREDPSAAARHGITLGGVPGREDGELAREARGIQRMLAKQGIEIPVLIVQNSSGTRQMALEFSPGQWAYLAYPSPPPSARGPMIFYLGLVALGTLAIALLAATMMTRPLRMLDEAISSVGPDGFMPHIDERGPVEVRATATALNRLSARLRSAVESRMRLVAAAGHDLRTPMTRMRLRAEFLPDEEREVWLNDLEELDRIADSAIRLVREEVAGTQAREPVDLSELIEGIRDELLEIGRQVEIADVPPGLKVRSRPLAFKRALRNLIENAALHGGGAEVSALREGNQLRILIRDSGPGIPEELMDRVFEPFFRVDPARRKLSPGAGLGLAIAREIIEQEGGQLQIRNRPTGGLEQSITLPVAFI